jgi:hypothetical protein
MEVICIVLKKKNTIDQYHIRTEFPTTANFQSHVYFPDDPKSFQVISLRSTNFPIEFLS